ncbi:MAG TPA: glutamate-1-semialdehyde 2,1-aminomutase [Candidatus Eisenbacteria bacterium]|nr:glutamate-1-semialdehyde 2,1-aminomutase [Candidatus Eisenbacteria bacterium]
MSAKAWAEARRALAGGVDSPVRAFKAVGGTPVFMSRGLGPHLYDDEGKRYLDLCLSWGAIILGHADEGVTAAVQRQAVLGTSFGTATEAETALARRIQEAFPGMERIRFTSSGTEAAMSAIRLARGVTGRKTIVKFEGCYHGHSDGLLVKAGSGLATFACPDSDGVPEEIAGLTAVLPYNDSSALKRFFAENEPPACVIVEPVAGNMGVVAPAPGFLETLRSLTSRRGTLLIFDEVITGYRVSWGGAQAMYGIRPDLTLLGKIIGGGLPVGAFGGSARIMNALAPEGRVYQAGTLSGNPLSMAAGRAVLSRLSPEFFRDLNARAASFASRLEALFRRRRLAASVSRVGSMFTPFFLPRRPRNFTEAARSDRRRFAKFFRAALSRGIYLPPSAFEASFLSSAHDPSHLESALEAFATC